jgi:predicted nucleotidyltransferase
MNESDPDRAFLAPLIDQLAVVEGLVGIALGGSRATGRHAPDSDWDLGVYVRGRFPVADIRRIVADAGWSGTVMEEGDWGPVMNGGAWLSIDDVSVDLHWRDLDTIDRLIAEAEQGEFSTARIPFHVAVIPSYVLLAELALGRTIWGELPRPGYPPALRTAAAAWWRDNVAFDLDYARKLADRGEVAGCVGLLARVLVQEGWARASERGHWATNEKRLLADTDLASTGILLGSAGTTPADLTTTCNAVAAAIAAPGRPKKAGLDF